MYKPSISDLENHKRLNEIENSITKPLLYDNTNENVIQTCKCSFRLAIIITIIILGSFIIVLFLFKK
jgi:hypothetical protein